MYRKLKKFQEFNPRPMVYELIAKFYKIGILIRGLQAFCRDLPKYENV